MYVLKIIGVAGPVTQRNTYAAVGQYVKSFDADAFNGRGDLVTTPDRKYAMTFATADQALGFWRQQSGARPLRPDGEPNRPLTAFHCSAEPL